MKGDSEMNKQSDCGTCSSEGCDARAARPGEKPEDFAERQALRNRLCRIDHKVLVLSGKGGVGKSMVAVNLAVSLSDAGKRVGLLDVDIHGPSVPKMLRLEEEQITIANGAIVPVSFGNLKVMSIGFLLADRDDAVIWRGPMKGGVIKQFLKDVEWGDLDYLIVDSPPGTGDEPLSVCQLIEGADGAIIVTTPQDVAIADVRKSIRFCGHLNLPVLGVVENMSGFVCPECGTLTDIFRSGGGERMAEEMKISFLGRIPINPAIGEAGDAGVPYIQNGNDSETAKAFLPVVEKVLNLGKDRTAVEERRSGDSRRTEGTMRIAIPVASGKLAMHFGHCETFAIFDVDEKKKSILNREDVTAPDHEPGLLPRWLAEREANLIIAGGMGSRAQDLFQQNGIRVQVGASAEPPEELVQSYLDGTLESGANVCDH